MQNKIFNADPKLEKVGENLSRHKKYAHLHSEL